MKEPKPQYACTECGSISAKWFGRCPHCNEFNTAQEMKPTRTAAGRSTSKSWTGSTSVVQDLKDVASVSHDRWDTGISEFNRVLGGGLVQGQVVLLGGDPGVGKSTLVMQALAHLSKTVKVVYATGEESSAQVADRAKRLGHGDAAIRLVAETSADEIVATLHKEQAQVAVIDSIATCHLDALESAAGSVSQLRECAAEFTRHAKTTGMALILIGHVTKDSTIAGPQVLNHIVDTVAEMHAEDGSSHRTMRSTKNRYGKANELGIFEMTETGLQSVDNPSALFLQRHDAAAEGSVVFGAFEDRRPLLLEIQALTEDTPNPNPRRYAQGLDTSRLNLILAVLAKHANVQALMLNVYVKALGGLRLTEPAADLAIGLALTSAIHGWKLPSSMVCFGELGLAGEVRAVPGISDRLLEAKRQGFTDAIVPPTKEPIRVPGLNIKVAKRVSDAVAFIQELRLA